MDYIRRLMEQVAQMLATILNRRRAGQHTEAAEEIARALLQTAGLPLDLIRQADPEALRQFLQEPTAQRMTRDVLVAELLLQDAELSEAAGRLQDAQKCRAHAFCLIADHAALFNADDAAEYRRKLDDLATRLGEGDSDPYLAEKLRAWRKQSGLRDGLTGSARPA